MIGTTEASPRIASILRALVGVHFRKGTEVISPTYRTTAQNGIQSIGFRVQPDLSEFGTPAVPAHVNSDVIFRTPFEDQDLTLDICTIVPLAQGC